MMEMEKEIRLYRQAKKQKSTFVIFSWTGKVRNLIFAAKY
jgi:hypothetical protein